MPPGHLCCTTSLPVSPCRASVLKESRGQELGPGPMQGGGGSQPQSATGPTLRRGQGQSCLRGGLQPMLPPSEALGGELAVKGPVLLCCSLGLPPRASSSAGWEGSLITAVKDESRFLATLATPLRLPAYPEAGPGPQWQSWGAALDDVSPRTGMQERDHEAPIFRQKLLPFPAVHSQPWSPVRHGRCSQRGCALSG